MFWTSGHDVRSPSQFVWDNNEIPNSAIVDDIYYLGPVATWVWKLVLGMFQTDTGFSVRLVLAYIVFYVKFIMGIKFYTTNNYIKQYFTQTKVVKT